MFSGAGGNMRSIVRFFTLLVVGIACLTSTQANAHVARLTPQECANMLAKGVITPANPVPCERLRRVHFQYVNFDNLIVLGNVVVLDIVAEQTEEIFSELLKWHFPIHKSIVMENYRGDDEASMADNNTSAFNGRPITDGSSWSKHAYGVAIDINPLQNPYLSLSQDGTAKVRPPASAQTFINRNEIRPNKKPRPGKVEDIVEILTRHGFLTWGGEWDFPIDYQHFEIGSQSFVNELIQQAPENGYQTFNRYVQSYRSCVEKSREKDPQKRRVACVEQVRR
jgi:hypothetical protein